jgi:c(7)-type cytochrome triheme protein
MFDRVRGTICWASAWRPAWSRACLMLLVGPALLVGLATLSACAPSGLVAELQRGQQPAPPPRQAAPVGGPASAPSIWVQLAADGVHDPRGPGISQLQQPADALAVLPPDSAGNRVRWVQALDSGAITPRSSILPGTEVRVREDDLIIAKFGSMPAVKFPHRQHTLWLDCSNCHPAPFKDKVGANRLSMMAILNGEQCGLCHGAVSFPLTECNRCHSVPNESLRRQQAAVQP